MVEERERALAEQLESMRKRKRKLVDPLQFEMSIASEDLTGYVPQFAWEMAPASDAQKAALEKAGICPDEIGCAGKASLLMDKIAKRRAEGLALSLIHISCLSRMLVMDEPSLAWRIHPQYVEALDSQAGTAWLQIMFADVTGRRPEAVSYTHLQHGQRSHHEKAASAEDQEGLRNLYRSPGGVARVSDRSRERA